MNFEDRGRTSCDERFHAHYARGSVIGLLRIKTVVLTFLDDVRENTYLFHFCEDRMICFVFTSMKTVYIYDLFLYTVNCFKFFFCTVVFDVCTFL